MRTPFFARGEVARARNKNAVQWSKGTGRPYSITERRVPELIPVLGSQPAGGVTVSH